jgi:hypothetical protein
MNDWKMIDGKANYDLRRIKKMYLQMYG